jgi:AraC-like DNA-binding protein
LNKLWMQRFHDTLPQIQVGTVRPGRRVIGFLTEAHQPKMQYRGVDVSAHKISNAFDMIHVKTAGDCRYGGMSLPDDDFDAVCQALMGHTFEPSPSQHLVRPPPDLMTRLRTLHGTIGQMANATPDILELPEVARALEQQLVHLMVRCLTEGEQQPETSGGRRHNAIVLRLEEFLEANPDRPLYLTEICAALGAPERTLRAACEEYLGMGPIRYLTLRRMHLVRRALLRETPSTATVTRLATDCGFWELGRFAVAYRHLFGETPSVSLRAAPVWDVRPNRSSSVTRKFN